MLELLGEIFNPGPVGSVELKSEKLPFHPKWIWIRFLIAIFLIGLFEYFIWNHSNGFESWESMLLTQFIFFLYTFISFFLHVKPDFSNTGWVPFVINNPFRISDNVNRLLFFLQVITLPGRFIFAAIVQGTVYFWYRFRRG